MTIGMNSCGVFCVVSHSWTGECVIHRIVFVFSVCSSCLTGVEGTNVERVMGRCITLKRSSVMEEVSTSAAFSVVSQTVLTHNW